MIKLHISFFGKVPLRLQAAKNILQILWRCGTDSLLFYLRNSILKSSFSPWISFLNDRYNALTYLILFFLFSIYLYYLEFILIEFIVVEFLFFILTIIYLFAHAVKILVTLLILHGFWIKWHLLSAHIQILFHCLHILTWWRYFKLLTLLWFF